MGTRDLGLRTRLALLLGLSPLLCALPARAEPFQVGGGGAFLGYAFGDGGGFEWGIEGFATRHLEHHAECGDDSSRHGFGPLLRLSMVKVSRLELTAAAHAGGELPGMRSYFAIDGELGASLFLEKNQAPRVAPHTGVTFESIIFHAYVRQEWLTPSFSVGGGARYAPTFGLPGFCEVGRPYRSANGRRQPARIEEPGRCERRCSGARLWAVRATGECASVPAFLGLALELSDLGAPLPLIERAVQAAQQELGHTRAAAHLAEQFGGAPVRLAPPACRPRRALPRPAALQRLVTESWFDGCLNEGFAAALAAGEASATATQEEAMISRRVAREEASHAALACDVLGWALSEAPALWRLLQLPAAPPRPKPGSSWLTPSQQLELGHHAAHAAEQRWAELRGAA
jgi:hypothetical protein